MNINTWTQLNFLGSQYHNSDLNHNTLSSLDSFYYTQGKPTLMSYVNNFRQ